MKNPISNTSSSLTASSPKTSNQIQPQSSKLLRRSFLRRKQRNPTPRILPSPSISSSLKLASALSMKCSGQLTSLTLLAGEKWRWRLGKQGLEIWEENNAGSHQMSQVVDFPGEKVAMSSRIRFISASDDQRVPCYRVLDDDGQSIGDSHEVSKETAVKMYCDMVTQQVVDSIFYEAQRQGRISFYLTSTGEEAINIASAAALSMDDIIFPQYREPGVLLWRGFTIQETQLPQTVGAACSLKMDKKDACVVTCFGDGGSSTGDFHSALNFAAVMVEPVIFFCRNNGWAISTPINDQFQGDGIVVRGRGYGIKSIRVDGNDALAIYNTVRTARQMAISEQRPILIELATTLRRPRPVEEIEWWRKVHDPVTRFRKWVERNGWWNDDEESQLRNNVRKQVLAAIQAAEKLEKPALAELFTDVYEVAPSNLREQERLLRDCRKTPGEIPDRVSLIDDTIYWYVEGQGAL
ncbi:hypothetical protein Droror1_Dr00007346 [Drosera rotundifolia]